MDLVKKDCFEVVQRDKNYLFINQYKLDRTKIKKMLLTLKKDDILYQVEDKEYLKYGLEMLLVLKKQFDLIDMFGRNRKEDVYIKIKMKENYLPIISFHKNE